MNWPSFREDISERQQANLESRSFGPIFVCNVQRTAGGHRRVGPCPTWAHDDAVIEQTWRIARMVSPSPFGPGIRWVTEVRPHRLGLTQRPEGGAALDASIAAWREAGADMVVSLLEPREVCDLRLEHEGTVCRSHGIEFHEMPMPNGGTPRDPAKLCALLDCIQVEVLRGKAVVIHCRAGIGRTGVIAGCVLLKLGTSVDDIFPLLTKARGIPVPDNDMQIEWLRCFAAAGHSAAVESKSL